MLNMDEIAKQIEFSALYVSLTSKSEHQKIGALNNPFDFLSLYISKSSTIIDVNNFKESLNYQRNLSTDSDYAFECFQLEITLLKDDKSVYLNCIIDFLFNCYEQSLKDNIFITNTIILLLSKICQPPFVTYLNSTNLKRLSKWFTLKEPIKSFVLKKLPEEKWFENSFINTLTHNNKYSFISKTTSFRTFKALFEGKYLEKKINWTGNKSSLCYFIKKLISEKVIHNPKNKHWEIVSEFFLLNGEPIKQSELINQKVTTNRSKTIILDYFVSSLKRYNS
jgi:hypothetical protein